MFLSIIVPVYNTESYLKDCLDSLVMQNLSSGEYEIICVNDGSTDGSLEILREYQCKYPQIKVIDKENEGVSIARNIALASARGNYVWFVDSDDLIQTNILSELKSIAIGAEADRVFFGCYAFYDNLSQEEIERWKCNLLVTNHYSQDISVWDNIFRKAFLDEEGIRFAEDFWIAEDSRFMVEVNAHRPKQVKIAKVAYLHRFRSSSLSTENTGTSKIKRLDSLIRMVEYLTSGLDMNESKNADLLMSNLWMALSLVAELSGKQRRIYLRELENKGLYPCKRPEACTLKKSYMTNRTDMIGKVFDFVYIHMHTRMGFWLMVSWKRLYQWLKRGEHA